MMPNCDIRDGFLFPTLTLMIDSYKKIILKTRPFYKLCMFVFQKEVIIQATGLFDIDYKNAASTPTSATPPPPTLAPTTAKQDIPTPGTKPTTT